MKKFYLFVALLASWAAIEVSAQQQKVFVVNGDTLSEYDRIRNMKNRIIIILSLVILGSYAQAYDFKATNEQGVELAFNVLSDGNSVEFTYDVRSSWSDNLNGFSPVYTYLTCDTLYIPSVVNYDGKEYIVTKIGSYAFMGMVPKVRVAVIPATITSIVYDSRGGAAFQGNNLQSIIVDSANPYFKSEKGILYTHDMKSLIAYPARNPQDTVVLREGIQTLEKSSLLGAQNIKYLELPLSLKTIKAEALSIIDTLHSLVIKDSVEKIESNVLDCRGLVRLTIGSGVKSVASSFLYSDSVVNLSCRAVVPPQVSRPGGIGFLQEVIEHNSRLYVPAKSIAAYRTAEGWSKFKYIYPIEPPIVAGVDQATVSWVQNFSATGYVWTLYSDEAHTQMVMTLTFDQRGYLTGIVLGNAASATQRALAQNVAADNGNSGNDNGSGDDSEKRFAEYYSFTISSLNRNTQYYYTRQSLSDNKVIDEESGSFATSDKTPTSTESATSPDDTNSDTAALKIISNGKVYILRDGKVYTSVGVEVK